MTGEYEYFWSVNDVTIYRQSNPAPFVWHGPNTFPPAKITRVNADFTLISGMFNEENMYDGDISTTRLGVKSLRAKCYANTVATIFAFRNFTSI